jgi:hypothetical protein
MTIGGRFEKKDISAVYLERVSDDRRGVVVAVLRQGSPDVPGCYCKAST